MRENVTYHAELDDLAQSLGLTTFTTKTIVTALNVPDDVDVLFLLSVPNTLKEMLLNSTRLLIYTPSNEHFGIVPLEAMLAGVPVLAANTGGPLETVVEGKTGWLCPPTEVHAWTAIMFKVLHELSPREVLAIGAAGTARVKAEFSDTKMAERLDLLITEMATAPRKNLSDTHALLTVTAFLIVFPILTYFAYVYPFPRNVIFVSSGVAVCLSLMGLMKLLERNIEHNHIFSWCSRTYIGAAVVAALGILWFVKKKLDGKGFGNLAGDVG